jgi:hypothetical protein
MSSSSSSVICSINALTNATTSATTKKKKQRWSRSEKRAAALQEAKARPAINRLIQCAEQCSLGATLLHLPEKDENIIRVVTTTASSPADSHQNCHIHIKPLLILDLNGILCHRIRKSKERIETANRTIEYRPIDAHVAQTPVIARPHLHAFLQHWQSSNVCLALWTSAKRKTVHALLEQLQIPVSTFLFVWGQDQCLATHDDLSMNNNASPLFQKDLQKVWIQYPLWNRHNTLLMDDSMEKIIPSQEEMAVHPIPLNGRQFDATSMILHDGHVCQEQELFLRHYVQHWQLHGLLEEYTKNEETWATTSASTTRPQWECLRDHSSFAMKWGGSLLSKKNEIVDAAEEM